MSRFLEIMLGLFGTLGPVDVLEQVTLLVTQHGYRLSSQDVPLVLLMAIGAKLLPIVDRRGV